MEQSAPTFYCYFLVLLMIIKFNIPLPISIALIEENLSKIRGITSKIIKIHYMHCAWTKLLSYPFLLILWPPHFPSILGFEFDLLSQSLIFHSPHFHFLHLFSNEHSTFLERAESIYTHTSLSTSTTFPGWREQQLIYQITTSHQELKRMNIDLIEDPNFTISSWFWHTMPIVME